MMTGVDVADMFVESRESRRRRVEELDGSAWSEKKAGCASVARAGPVRVGVELAEA